MTKLEFLRALENRLRQLPEAERRRQAEYFAEMIDDRIEDGCSETDAVNSLGDVGSIAERVLQVMPLPVLVRSRMKPRNGWTALTVVLLVIGSPVWLPILLGLLTVVLSVYVVFWSVILVLFSAVLAIGLGGLGLMLSAVMSFGAAFILALMPLGGGLICLGLSIFAFFGALAVARALVRLTAVLARWTKSLLIRGEETQ